MNALTKAGGTQPSGGTGGGTLIPQNMDQAVRLAEMMARGKMLPQHLQNSPGDCLMVVEQAMRWQMSPFAVAQCTSSIKGKLMFEGKLVAAAIEASGAITGLIDYQFSGTGQDRKVVVSATRTGEATPKTVEVALKDAATDNGVWKKQPDQQLAYHGARVWGRRWTPGVMLGIYSREEFSANGEVFDGTTIEAKAEPAAPADPLPTPADWAKAVAIELAQAQSAAGVGAICRRDDVIKFLAEMPPAWVERLNEHIHRAVARTSGPIEGTDDFPGDMPSAGGR